MDDIELAFNLSNEFGRLYKAGKAFSLDAPMHALSYLRGLANVFCDTLTPALPGRTLDQKIKDLEARKLLTPSAKRNLRTLQQAGNIASHPENFEFETQNFGALAEKALEASRSLIEQVYLDRQERVPDYVVAEVESSALKEMCSRAMLDRESNAMNEAGEYFKEKAEQITKKDICYRPDGYGVWAKEDIEQAMFWFRQGADAGHLNCLFQYGHYVVKTRDSNEVQRREAENFILRAANDDHPEALVYVAQATLDGEGVFEENVVYARELFERAAEQEHPVALAQLGAIYAQGLGCEIDHRKAATYSKRAADLGYPQGQFNLYVLYHDGTGVEQDEQEGIKWLMAAADQDYPKAVYNLACAIQGNKIAGRSRVDAIAQFERAMAFPEFRARAALSAAEILDSAATDTLALCRAAEHLQQCFETLSRYGDPHNLRATCLNVCVKVVRRLREWMNTFGISPTLDGRDLFASARFDRNCVPVPDWSTRKYELAERLYETRIENADQSAEYLMREACLKADRKKPSVPPSPQTRRLMPIRVTPKQKPNEICTCGSNKKYKKCHGQFT